MLHSCCFSVVNLWVLGRVSFWFMDFIGVFLVAILNISLTIWIIHDHHSVFADAIKRHISLGFTLITI
ncbi:hypothetical protein MASR2M54_19410 [Aliarcobacter cryaerophilus]